MPGKLTDAHIKPLLGRIYKRKLCFIRAYVIETAAWKYFGLKHEIPVEKMGD